MHSFLFLSSKQFANKLSVLLLKRTLSDVELLEKEAMMKLQTELEKVGFSQYDTFNDSVIQLKKFIFLSKELILSSDVEFSEKYLKNTYSAALWQYKTYRLLLSITYEKGAYWKFEDSSKSNNGFTMFSDPMLGLPEEIVSIFKGFV